MARPFDPNRASNPLVRDLVDACDASGLSQAEIAERAGVHQGFVTKLRKAGKTPSLDFVEWVGGVFGWRLVWVKDLEERRTR